VPRQAGIKHSNKMRSIKNISEKLDSYKGIYLILLTIIYIFGYIIWAYHSYKLKIGLIPFLDFQYLVAGIPIVIIIVLIGIIYSWLDKLYKFNDIYPKLPRIWQVIITYAAWYLGLVAFYITGLIYTFELKSFEFFHLLIILPLGVIVVFATSKQNTNISLAIKNLQWLFIITSIAIVLQFVDKLYYKIPIEFGGLKPKSAIFEINGDLNLQSVINNNSADTSHSSSILIHTEVIYISNDSYFIEMKDNSNKMSILEIPKGKVNYVIWGQKNPDLTNIIQGQIEKRKKEAREKNSEKK
jgi:hypothetical protein